MANKGLIYNIRRKIQVLAYMVTNPEFMSKIYYKIIMGHKLDINNPQTLNEKIQWLKLNEWPKNKLAIKCTDKYEVREFIKEKGMGNYLNDLIGVWDNVSEIDFDKLPNKFALKCTHGCGYNIICDNKDELNIKKIKKQLKKWIKEDFAKFNAEPHYTKIKPRIICEKYLGENITDYKFYCFNGKMEFVYIASGFGKGIDEKITFFDKNGKKAPFKRMDYDVFEDAKLPENFEKMKQMSEKLSKEFPFVRVDWFEEGGKIYFAELTFTPAGGLMKVEPPEYDKKWGDLIDLKLNQKIAIIGHFGGANYFVDGQTVKTKEINNYIEKKLKITTDKLDTYKIYKHPYKTLKKLKKIIKNNSKIIIILSNRGYKILLPIINYYNRNYRKKIIEFVIGGNRNELFKNKFLKSQAKKTDKIYVETQKLMSDYTSLGFNNVEVVPNFKNLEIKQYIKTEKKDIINLCTFSRVSREKGIVDAIELVKSCNNKLGKDAFKLDIYGQIDENFQMEFSEIKKTFDKNIEYKGIVEFDKSTDILTNYDVMLFLTHWEGEGFPGTLIDAFFAGIPVVATNWKHNFDILKDDYTGVMVEIENKKEMVQKMITLYNNQEKIIKMKRNCNEEAKKYLPDNVMDKVIKYIIT